MCECAQRACVCGWMCGCLQSENYQDIELVSAGRNEHATGNLFAEFDVCKRLGGKKQPGLDKEKPSSRTSLIKD